MNQIPDDIDFAEWAKFCGTQEAQFIKPISDWSDAVKDRLAGKGEYRGLVMPWSKTHNKINFRPGEVTIWAGINGHGKSQFLGQCVLWFVQQARVLVASMEMKGEAQAERWLRQASCGAHPADRFVDRWMTWTDDRLWLYDQLDTVESSRILGMIHYAAQELGVTHIVIDSLMKCGIAPDDYGAQKGFVDRLCWAAKTMNIHIHLVHHIRKGEREGKRPDKFDIKGAGEITDMVDNVCIVHRNKLKEEKREAGADYDEADPDATLSVAKQRHGEWEGIFKFWFHKESQQYTPDQRNNPLPWPSAAGQWGIPQEANHEQP